MSFTFQVTGMEDLMAKMSTLPDRGKGVAAQALLKGLQ